eukprot:TRINITY_DN105_c0_g1_i1.p1 TRINITY_DN105_c0_g1~~TRINITY_DN105_c0_g1_i1.p1  ORF type:complete len:130 (+),score=29.92 TRINITY_DN105_c0_g1_i1:113-502(+)
MASTLRVTSVGQAIASFSGLRASPKSAAVTVSPAFVTRTFRSLTISCSAAPETLTKVRNIIATQLAVDVDKIAPESKFVDLGADSLDTVEIMMALEEQFDITLDEDGAEKIGTVQEAADLIQEQMGAKA